MKKEKKTKEAQKRKIDKQDLTEKDKKKGKKMKKDIPVQINIIGWFGIALSLTYIIWSVVSIILSILDRTYASFGENLIILIYGTPILILSSGFRNKQRWGWYGLAVVLGFVVIWSLFTFKDIYGLIWGILALGALIGIFLPSVREHYFAG